MSTEVLDLSNLVSPIQIVTTGVSHLALQTSNLARARAFYVDLLGLPTVVESPDFFIVAAGATIIGLLGPSQPNHALAPVNGLDHLALGIAGEAELNRISEALGQRGVLNAEVKVDPATNKPYIALQDPDGIWIELYLN